MRKYFKLLTQGSQNVSIKTFIRVSNFDLKTPNSSDNIDNMQTEFSQNCMYTPFPDLRVF